MGLSHLNTLADKHIERRPVPTMVIKRSKSAAIDMSRRTVDVGAYRLRMSASPIALINTLTISGFINATTIK
jgi:hypothetical protein